MCSAPVGGEAALVPRPLRSRRHGAWQPHRPCGILDGDIGSPLTRWCEPLVTSSSRTREGRHLASQIALHLLAVSAWCTALPRPRPGRLP